MKNKAQYTTEYIDKDIFTTLRIRLHQHCIDNNDNLIIESGDEDNDGFYNWHTIALDFIRSEFGIKILDQFIDYFDEKFNEITDEYEELSNVHADNHVVRLDLKTGNFIIESSFYKIVKETRIKEINLNKL